MRSTTRPTEGKSMAISTEKHSYGISVSGDRIEQEPCPQRKNVPSVEGRCASACIRRSYAYRAIRMPPCVPPANGFALTATTLKKPRRRADEGLARADRQQNFFAERI